MSGLIRYADKVLDLQLGFFFLHLESFFEVLFIFTSFYLYECLPECEPHVFSVYGGQKRVSESLELELCL